MAAVIAAVRKHAAEEEMVFLPDLRSEVGPEKMGVLGLRYIDAKRSAPTYAHPHAPDTPPGNKILGAGAALVDKVRDKVSGRQARLATDASGFLDPQAQTVLDAFCELGPLPIEVLTPAKARKQPTAADAVRKVLADRGESTAPEPVGGVEELTLTSAGGDRCLRVYRPASRNGQPAAGVLPVLVYVHGGGWVIGDLDVYDASCRGLANKAGCIVVSVEYRHAPEHPFPAAHDDVLAATRWVMAHAADLGGDPARVAIAGESAGGNLAASTCLQLKAAGERQPVFQLLVYPVTTGEQYGESNLDAADAHPLNRPMMSWFAMHTFDGNPGAAADPRFDLLGLPPDQLAGLPPALVITDERDPLRDQGEQFARHLHAAGVPVTATRYDGAPHEFFGMAAVVDKAEQTQQEAALHLRRAFGARQPVPAG